MQLQDGDYFGELALLVNFYFYLRKENLEELMLYLLLIHMF